MSVLNTLILNITFHVGNVVLFYTVRIEVLLIIYVLSVFSFLER